MVIGGEAKEGGGGDLAKERYAAVSDSNALDSPAHVPPSCYSLALLIGQAGSRLAWRRCVANLALLPRFLLYLYLGSAHSQKAETAIPHATLKG